MDRSSAPRRVANRTAGERVEVIFSLRRLRLTAAEIAERLGMALSTVSGILTRGGLGRLGRLGLEQPVRYEPSRPGELVHIDLKKLGRIQGGAGKRVRGGVRPHYTPQRGDRDGKRRNTVGWEYVHIAVDVDRPVDATASGFILGGGVTSLPARRQLALRTLKARGVCCR